MLEGEPGGSKFIETPLRLVREKLRSSPDITIAGEVIEKSGELSESILIFIAPNKPSFDPKDLSDVMRKVIGGLFTGDPDGELPEFNLPQIQEFKAFTEDINTKKISKSVQKELRFGLAVFMETVGSRETKTITTVKTTVTDEEFSRRKGIITGEQKNENSTTVDFTRGTIIWLLPHIRLAQIILANEQLVNSDQSRSMESESLGLFPFRHSVPVEFEQLLNQHQDNEGLRAAMIKFTPFGGRKIVSSGGDW